ncbi:MAG: hypothetical protein JW702_05005 [Clostridiales bacterium]|nr:hypothetical protein [Clostridiales bacterium]
MDSKQKETTVQSGPIIIIRNPLWTNENPRQDIPIMIFTIAQWYALQNDEFHIGAAPIGPSDLGRNQIYMMALPARYNYAYSTGYEEVDTVINNHSLEVY